MRATTPTPHVPQRRNETRQELDLLSAEYAELLAHARAAVAAAHDGELDPMAYLEGFLEERGQLPPCGIPAAQLVAVAFARTADADRTFQQRGDSHGTP